MLVQFKAPPTADNIAALEDRGFKVLQVVPENGLLVVVKGRARLQGLGVRYAASIAPSDKISPMIAGGDALLRNAFYLAEFHPDVDMDYARTLVLNLGLELRENSDLNPHQLMIRVDDANRLSDLAALDEAAYIFPASNELRDARPVRACAGPLVVAATTTSTPSQMIAANGPGWDGYGLNATSLNYVFGQMTAKVAAGSPQVEIQRAMAEWSKVIKLSWVQATNPTAARTVSIFFASGDHGDGYPFDGPYGVLAHTFYPAPPNPEPIAGDMHFDADESWMVGANMDIFSVALHELGHALGLGHSDNPADVMYPYYKIATTLAAGDTAAIQTMYAPQTGTDTGGTGGVPTPLTMTVAIPPASTSASSIAISGTVSSGSGAISITWSTYQGASGIGTVSGGNWTIASVPLAAGVNSIFVTATDSSTHVSTLLTVTRTTSTPPGQRDNTAPALNIASPSGTSISTSLAALSFSGTASDNVGVTGVTWSTNTGKSGTATGTNQWSTAPIPLLVGSNTVTIRASDAAGNVGWRSVVVKRF